MFLLFHLFAAQPVMAAPVGAPNAEQAIAAYVTEASQRFGIPERWIYAVMSRESRRNPGAISPKGAQGLMQIMPATWQELRTQLKLGDDPFDPHDNIIAGTAYLRALYDRYGVNGFLAAYNAGPGRYEEWLTRGRPLPLETREYVAFLMQTAALSDAAAMELTPSPIPISWRQSALFVTPQVQADEATSLSPFSSAATPFTTVSPFPPSKPDASTTP